MLTLREEQLNAINWVRHELSQGAKRVILQSPTGTGKTVMGGEVIRGALTKGRRVLFLAHRRELIKQCSNKLAMNDIEHGIIMAGNTMQEWLPVQIASIDTLRSWQKRGRMVLPRADIIMIDECHRSLSPTYIKIIEAYENSVVIGLTATPCRGDGRGLGHVYESLVCAPDITWQTENGRLVPLRYFAPATPDMSGVKVMNTGDYNEKQKHERMDQAKLIGDIVEHWFRLAPNEQTIVFASGVSHSMHIRDRFREAGVKAEHLDGDTPTDERDSLLKRFEDREFQVLSNCMVLVEGWDCPIASACILANPTKSLVKFMQMIGRIMRPYKGKAEGLVIDHSGSIFEHGFVHEVTDWALDKSGSMHQKRKEIVKEREDKEIVCEECFTVYRNSRYCPACGHQNKRHARVMVSADGDLVEVKSKKKKPREKNWTAEEKQLWFSMFLGYARIKGFKDGWASHKYRAKFKVWPRGMEYREMPPNNECLAYIKHLNIKAAYARKRGMIE